MGIVGVFRSLYYNNEIKKNDCMDFIEENSISILVGKKIIIINPYEKEQSLFFGMI